MSELASVRVERRNGADVVFLSGEIDLSNAAQVEAAILAARAESVVVDVSRLAYLDSAGLAVLDRVARALGEAGRQLRLAVAPDAIVRRVLELSGLAGAIPLDADGSSADGR